MLFDKKSELENLKLYLKFLNKNKIRINYNINKDYNLKDLKKRMKIIKNNNDLNNLDYSFLVKINTNLNYYFMYYDFKNYLKFLEFSKIK